MASASKTLDRSKRDAASKLAEQRLNALELAKEHGNVAEASRRRALPRTAQALLDNPNLLLRRTSTHPQC